MQETDFSKKNPLFINKVLSFGKDQKNQKTNK